jgi:hypothetical protein
MIFDRFPTSDGLGTIEIDADRVNERKERHSCESEAGEEAKFRGLGAKIKDCDGDGGDVN